MTLGEKLRKLRKQKGITQEEAAKWLGLSTRSYAAYELDETVPRGKQGYEKLAKFYDVPVSEFYDSELTIEGIQLRTLLRNSRKFNEKMEQVVAKALEYEGWFIRSLVERREGDILAVKNNIGESIVVIIKCFLTEKTKVFLGQEVYKLYGRLATLNTKEVIMEHIVVVTNNEDFVRAMYENPPINLKFKISARLIDLKSGKLGDWIPLVE